VSCTAVEDDKVEAMGLAYDASEIVVVECNLDSISFASGTQIWVLNGLMVAGGKELPFNVMFNEKPTDPDPDVIQTRPPAVFTDRNNSDVACVSTFEAPSIRLSWRTNNQFLCVQTVLTSVR
jgi:hypothetical protein